MYIDTEGEAFTAKPVQLSGLLSGIGAQKIALPRFQRRWVWEPERVKELIVSVAYLYPAGSLLTMPVTDSQFALRPFEGAGEILQGKPDLMVLDGQQRLTSLYEALYRADGVEYRKRRYHFYLDVSALSCQPNESAVAEPQFAESLFYVVDKKDGHRVRYEGLVPRYELTTQEQDITAGALPLCHVFDPDGKLAKWRELYLLSRAEKSLDAFVRLGQEWDRLVKPWLDRMRGYHFPVTELAETMPLGAICYIFEKVNSMGVPLDVFDLCNAVLWAQGFFLNQEWETTKATLKDGLRVQPLSGTHWVQGLSLLDSLARKRASPNTGGAVTCRKEDLMKLGRSAVEKRWKSLVTGYEEAGRFMTEQGILAERILPYTTLIVPLSVILSDVVARKGKAHLGAAWPKIKQWYWCSVFSQRYSSQIETNAAKDSEQVLAWIDGGEPPDAVRTFTFRSDSLQEIRSIRNVIYKGVLCLLARNGALDLGGKGKLSTELFGDTHQDHHHIFPVAALERLRVKDPRIDTIVNKTLISAEVNRSIRDTLPSVYVPQLTAKYKPEALDDKTFEDRLRTHLADPTALKADHWNDFVVDRRERLRELIHSVCGGRVEEFTYDVPEDEAMEEEGDER